MTVRLWIGDEDYGLMSERAAGMYLEIHKKTCPDEPYRIERVPDDPQDESMTVEFLERYQSNDGRWFGVGEIANLPEGEARVLIRTGRAREYKVKEEPEG